jgi:uncharacterized membrane protein YidH (DUF202 family)
MSGGALKKKKKSSSNFVTRYMRSLEFKSLADVWYTLIFTLIQLICIYHAYINIQKYSSQTWQPFERPQYQIWFYLGCLLMAVSLLPIYIWSGLFKIGKTIDHIIT